MRALRWGAAALALTLAACSSVGIKPELVLPRPLLEPMPATVALVLPNELRNYTHRETRWGVDWKIELGPGHVRLMRDIFKDSFRQVEEFQDLAAARAATGLKALFEPRIDQFSFVTDHDTGGRYFAVTIRYRIDLYTPQGEKYDTLTLTGYGSALAKGMSSGSPLEHAALAAMRDAAAKFLVQFPDQPAGALLVKDQALTLQAAPVTAESTQIEAVPIEEVAISDAGVPAAAPAPVAAPPPVPAAPQPPPPNAPSTAPPTTPPVEGAPGARTAAAASSTASSRPA